MNVTGTLGGYGLATGEVGVDLVDAGMILHAAAMPAGLPLPASDGFLAATSMRPAGAGPDWRPPATPDPLDPRSRPAPSRAARPILAHLDRLGLAAALLHPVAGADWATVLDATAAAPGRLRAVLPLASLDPPSDLALMARHGLAGVSTCGATLGQDPAPWRATLSKFAAHGLHLHLTALPEQWDALLPLVLGHGTAVRVDLPAGPVEAASGFAALERHAAHPDLWIGFQPAAVRDSGLGALLDRLLAAAGPDRLLWASGGEGARGRWDMDDHLLALLDLLPWAEARHAVCGGNARWLAFAVEPGVDTID